MCLCTYGNIFIIIQTKIKKSSLSTLRIWLTMSNKNDVYIMMQAWCPMSMTDCLFCLQQNCFYQMHKLINLRQKTKAMLQRKSNFIIPICIVHVLCTNIIAFFSYKEHFILVRQLISKTFCLRHTVPLYNREDFCLVF